MRKKNKESTLPTKKVRFKKNDNDKEKRRLEMENVNLASFYKIHIFNLAEWQMTSKIDWYFIIQKLSFLLDRFLGWECVFFLFLFLSCFIFINSHLFFFVFSFVKSLISYQKLSTGHFSPSFSTKKCWKKAVSKFPNVLNKIFTWECQKKTKIFSMRW